MGKLSYAKPFQISKYLPDLQQKECLRMILEHTKTWYSSNSPSIMHYFVIVCMLDDSKDSFSSPVSR